MARLAITSLTFMLVCVPEPVCQTDERKLIVELAVDDFLRRLHDRLGAPRIEQAELAIDFGGGALDQRQRRDQRPRHALVADAEIIARPLGLRAPIVIGRNFDRAEAVGFGAGFHERTA